MPRLLELFSGTATLAKRARARGWETFTVDANPACQADLQTHIALETILDLPFPDWDMIWASPPCESFSVASISTHWGGGWRAYEPKTAQAKLALELVGTLALLIESIDPTVWYVENPRGVMRKVAHYERIKNCHTDLVYRRTVTYCQYGDERMKPTDIWTNNQFWAPRPMCKNGDPCHVAAPRGAKTGTQGRNTYLHRSQLPLQLCEDVLDAAEVAIEAQRCRDSGVESRLVEGATCP